MQTYSKFRPTSCDTYGLGCNDRRNWLVAPVSTTRDADALQRSNFRVVLADLGGESDNVEVHRFGHWANGWFEIILVRPETKEAESAEQWECALSDYPVACDSDFSELEQEDADETWANCYSPAQRIEYIRDHREEFEFRGFADMLACVRGRFFGGYASSLL
jgi:hypothetical protein